MSFALQSYDESIKAGVITVTPKVAPLCINFNLACDPTPAFKGYLNAHFLSLQKAIMATQVSLDTLTAAMVTLTTDVADVNTNVLAVLAKLAAGGGLTTDQQTQLDAAVAALQSQNTAIEAVDAQLKTVLP